MTDAEGSRIRMLSTNVANKIAAGEVVERPASVIKELLENSIDAGATRVDIVVTAGGRNLISISDDGSGMNRDDAIMAPERQATSKIREVDDIEHIATLGFRGEALASIASVSRFTLRTRTRSSDVGTEVTIAGGKMMDVKDCGCPVGTLIEVRDLFFNVPARRKFLRAYQTEQAHIRNTFTLQAIAYPHVAMSLKSDGAYEYQLAAAETLHDRLLDIAGHDEMERMIPFDSTLGGIRVHGYAGIPTWSRTDSLGQRVYINRRPASAPVVQAAIREAYPRMDDNRRPVVYLFIDLPPGDVDVNVHPTKREVRFRRVGDVRDAVISALSSALNRSAAPMPADAAIPAAPASTPPWGHGAQHDSATARAETPPGVMPPVRPHPEFSFTTAPGQPFSALRPKIRNDVAHAESAATVVDMPEGAPWTCFRIIGTLSTGYVLMETNDGYTVLDPAAAHERVIYEKLLAASGDSPAQSQRLLIPETVEMRPLDASRISKIMNVLKEMGFGIEAFGKDTFKVDAVPEAIGAASCTDVLLDAATALEEAGYRRGRERLNEELVAKSASRAAVRAGKPLDMKELEAIVVQLAACNMPYTSPDGRPTMIYTSMRELDRRFGRK